MPSLRRRIFVLLVVACLGAAVPVTLAFAQGAGDQQYEDPFGGSGTSTTKSAPKTQTTTPSSTLAPLSPSPQSSGTGSTGSSGSSGTATTPSTSTTPAPVATAQGLPNTGADARVLLLAGGALLLIGLGLRLRSAPERF